MSYIHSASLYSDIYFSSLPHCPSVSISSTVMIRMFCWRFFTHKSYGITKPSQRETRLFPVFQLWKPHVSQNHVQLPHHAINLSSICHQYHLFYVTMRSSPCFFWTAQLSGLRDTASWCRFPVHAAPRCPWFPHVPQSFSLDLSPLNRNLFCSSKWLENI